ncbi:MAG: transposase, partial [Planctomycetaceae bacterium]|nr:transposase [Planctomycetaceae bacterium]
MHLRDEQTELAGSYQAFLKLLRRWTGELVTLLQHALRWQMQQFEQHWKLHGLVVIGVDGSRINLPRTKSHQAAYAPTRTSQRRKKTGRGKQRKPSRQKHAEGPQFWLTTMYHVALHLPWDWRIGPSNSSERADALEMLATIPEKSLLCGDAGFVGYDASLLSVPPCRGLLVRVGSNVKLLKKLGFVRENSQTAYVWPDKVASRNDPPLVFRHITVQGPRSTIHLVISLPEGQKLSDQQVAEIYRARWGVEVFYRQFKQTFQRRKLRSHAAANARVELEWSLVGLCAILLYASHELVRQNIALKRLSAAGSLRAFRQMARDYLHPANPRDTLRIRLRQSLVDTYYRSNKASR